MENIKTYEEFAGTSEKIPQKIAEYIAYLKENAKEIWKSKSIK